MNKNINLLWKSFKGIRKLNTINSDVEFGADIAHNVRLSKEKSGQIRSIRSSGWFEPKLRANTATGTQTVGSSLSDITVNAKDFVENYLHVAADATRTFTFDGDKWINQYGYDADMALYGISYTGTPVANDEITVVYHVENIIRLFSANMSGYTASDQLIAFTKTDTAINIWLLLDSAGNNTPFQIATFPLVTDVTDVCMTQWGDKLGMVFSFGVGVAYLGFVYYSADATIGGTQMGTTSFYYKQILLSGAGITTPVMDVTSIKPYGSRLAINGYTTYDTGNSRESVYGVWFSEAGNPTNFAMTYISSATDTSAFYVETGEYANKLEQYHGLTAFCRNRSYNITGTTQNDITVEPLTAKGVFGNATFTINGKCAYVDSWTHNIFTLRDNIDSTIGFDKPVGDDIQDYLADVENVTVNVLGRRVRMVKESGESLVYDVDIGEWTEENLKYGENVTKIRAVTFLNNEYFCTGNTVVYLITNTWQVGSRQTPDDEGYYSHYKTNLIWLDSQTSVKSHIYPFAIILEPQTSNDFFVKFTTDRGDTFQGRVTKAGYTNVATYSNDDTVPENGSQFVADDDDTSGRVFFSMNQTELLVTVDRPPFWRYLQIDIYTTLPSQQFNISGIEAKNTFITDEQLDY